MRGLTMAPATNEAATARGPRPTCALMTWWELDWGLVLELDEPALELMVTWIDESPLV
jgi:hypothetical protein